MSGDVRGDAFLVANSRGVVVDVNDAGCRLFGRSKAALVGLHLAPHNKPEIAAEVGRRWSELEASGSIAGAARIERPDGDHRDVEYVAQTDLPLAGWTLVRFRPTNGVVPP